MFSSFDGGPIALLTTKADTADGGPRAVLRVVDEADDYTSSLAGVTVDGARVGRGVGPNVVLSVPHRQLTVSSSYFGFPMTSGAHVPEDRVVAIHVHENPAGSKWCGVAMRKGFTYLYAPGSEHVATSHPGLHITYAITTPKRLAAVADRCGSTPDIPRASGLYEMPSSPLNAGLGRRLNRLTTAALGGALVACQMNSVLESLAEVLADRRPESQFDFPRGLDSRAIVTDCIDHAAAIDRVPTIAELCLAAHVSERRLRSAFCEEFERSPTRYFRTWALDRAHRRLRDAVPGECTVSQTACDLGFDHLGRFSGWYREVYGETPSMTLRAP